MAGSPSAVRIPVGDVQIDADFVPPGARGGIVVFAHGSGSDRHSPRNVQVAQHLQERGLGTLLLDLLSEPEAREDEDTSTYRFDIPLLTERLLAATDWLLRQPVASGQLLGYFGASTGGAVAMIASTLRAKSVGAIVLRGARSDLGDYVASRIECPTLLLVGENDPYIRKINEATLRLLRCEKQLDVVAGATHLFEEPGALDMVGERSAEWFDRYLRPRPPP